MRSCRVYRSCSRQQCNLNQTTREAEEEDFQMDTLDTVVQHIQVRVDRVNQLAAFLILASVFYLFRKLFTFVVALNSAGIALAASGHFPYAKEWTGAMALGNLNVAILIRNELFGRFLYWFVTTCFAKVTIVAFFSRYLEFSAHHLSFISGRRCGGGLAARLFFRYFVLVSESMNRISRQHRSISEAFIAVVHCRVLAGSYSRL